MTDKCPGKDIRNLYSAFYKCPKCSEMVEIFSDEARFRCKHCGEYVFRDRAPSCVEWCVRARECFGEQRWQALKGQGKEESNAKD